MQERTLDSDADNSVLDLPGAERGLVAIREMSGPIGIPDLTAITGGQAAMRARMEIAVPPLLNKVDAAVVANLNRSQSKSIAQVASALHWPESTILRRLPVLLKCGAVIESKPNRFVRPGNLEPIGNIFAIEQKIKKYRAALHQARVYSTWADSYVIVMDALNQRQLEFLRSEVVIDAGGLIVDGSWILRPRIRRPSRSKRLWASEHAIAAVWKNVGGVYQPSTDA